MKYEKITGNQAYIDALKLIMQSEQYAQKFEDDVVKGIH